MPIWQNIAEGYKWPKVKVINKLSQQSVRDLLVHGQKVSCALMWLVKHNPAYKDKKNWL